MRDGSCMSVLQSMECGQCCMIRIRQRKRDRIGRDDKIGRQADRYTGNGIQESGFSPTAGV